MVLIHKLGLENVVLDALSRCEPTKWVSSLKVIFLNIF